MQILLYLPLFSLTLLQVWTHKVARHDGARACRHLLRQRVRPAAHHHRGGKEGEGQRRYLLKGI